MADFEEALESDVEVFEKGVMHRPTGAEFVAYSRTSQSGNLTISRWKSDDGRIYDERKVRELLGRCWLKELDRRGVVVEGR